MAVTRFIGDRFVGLSSDTKPLNVEDYATYKEYNGVFNEYILVSGSWMLSNPTGEGASYSGYSGYSGYGSGVSGYSGLSGYSGVSGYSGILGEGNIFYLSNSSNNLGKQIVKYPSSNIFSGVLVSSGTSTQSTFFYANSGTPGLNVLPPGDWRFYVFSAMYLDKCSCRVTPVVGITEDSSFTGLLSGNSVIVTGISTGIYFSTYRQTGEIKLQLSNRLAFKYYLENIYPTGASTSSQVNFEFGTGNYFEGTIFKGQRGGIGYDWSGALLSTFLNTTSGVAFYDTVASLRAETYRKAAIYITKGSGAAYDGGGSAYFFETELAGTDDGTGLIKPNDILAGSNGRYKYLL